MSASHSVDVEDVVVTATVVIVREDTDVVKLAERARREHHPVVSHLSCKFFSRHLLAHQETNYFNSRGAGMGRGRGAPPS